MVLLLFLDFKNFTQLTQELTPAELVQNLDSYFTQFDDIVEKPPRERAPSNLAVAARYVLEPEIFSYMTNPLISDVTINSDSDGLTNVEEVDT